jgi:hypothetical protein
LDSTLAAGIIQAVGTFVPTVVIAVAAVVGLQSWRQQLIGGRAVDRAEACLVGAHEVVDLIRACRSSLITNAEEDASTPEGLWTAANAIRDASLARAWESWRTFAAQYRRAGFFLKLPEKDAAKEIAVVLTELSGVARLIATYEARGNDTTSFGPAFRQQLVGYRARFLGYNPDGSRNPDDPLEVRLRNALASLEQAMLPVTGGERPVSRV